MIVPVKPLNQAKTRLAQVLSPTERQNLAETMLRHVLGVVQHVPQLMGTLVISRDNRALSIAREYGARTVQESGAPELNSALMRATQVISRLNGSAILILPADLPLLEAEDVTSIIRLGEREPSMVIATDQHQDGTNALFIRPPGLIEYAYGPGSFQRHVAKAHEVGAIVNFYQSDRLSLDIDMPADLKFYSELTQGLASP
ncbi:MAG: 2-phospho-L-lactate guanylyltransferase [Chloroflexi bacterium]|nr:2-phospho-L-lactate guanylyltransferase [Chloroflexota bacterium]MCC6896405.1 2-phospho-L-lactate guanylyltransferase [Anaerolineae bacterium]